MTLTIRDAKPDDEAVLIGFLSGIQDVERKFHPSRRPAPDVIPAYYRDLVARNADILIADDAEDRPVGMVCGWLDSEDDPLQRAYWREYGWVSDIFVVEDRRGEEIGLKLLTAIGERLRGKGARRLRICSIAPNEAAIGAYRRFGFTEFEITFDKPL